MAAVSAKISFNVVFFTPKFTNGLRGERVKLCSLNSGGLGLCISSLITLFKDKDLSSSRNTLRTSVRTASWIIFF